MGRLTYEQFHRLAIAPLPQFYIIKPGAFYNNYGPNNKETRPEEFKIVPGEGSRITLTIKN